MIQYLILKIIIYSIKEIEIEDSNLPQSLDESLSQNPADSISATIKFDVVSNLHYKL